MTDTLDSHWMSALLEASPAGILLFDDHDRIKWANVRMSAMTGLPVEELKSLDRETAAHHRLEMLFDKPERLELPASGNQKIRCLECRYETLTSPAGETIRAVFYLDKTEQCLLEERVERLSLSDELTGTLNRRGLLRDLETLVSRSRRYDNHLLVMMLEFDVPKGEQANNFIFDASRCLREQVRWADIIGRFAENSFLLLLPETDIEAAQCLAQKIFEQLEKMPLAEGMETRPKVYCGVSQWQRGNDVNMLLERVETAVASARSNDSMQFVAA
jgi:diguanylate cyclase (GGDEF)-like protein